MGTLKIWNEICNQWEEVILTPGGAEIDPVVGAINGIPKADGAGNISAATINVDYAKSWNILEIAGGAAWIGSGHSYTVGNIAFVNGTDLGGGNQANCVFVCVTAHSSSPAFLTDVANWRFLFYTVQVGYVTGLLKGDGAGNVAAASDGTDYVSSVAADTTPQLGGDLDVNGKSIDWGAIISVNGTYKGETLSVTVDANAIGFSCLLAQGADFHFDDADASAMANCNMLCIAVEAGTGTKKVLIKGQVCNTSWTWVSGVIYASESAGQLTQSLPVGEDAVIVPVAWALSANTIYFDPYAGFATTYIVTTTTTTATPTTTTTTSA